MRDYDFDDKTLEFIYWILIYINFEPEAHGIFLTKEGGGGEVGGGVLQLFIGLYVSYKALLKKNIYIGTQEPL